MYSSLLGIGVALLAEAFVILLTILVLEVGQKLGWRDRHDEKA